MGEHASSARRDVPDGLAAAAAEWETEFAPLCLPSRTAVRERGNLGFLLPRSQAASASSLLHAGLLGSEESPSSAATRGAWPCLA